ncbi:MAG: hypothetical protein H0W20_03465 [Chthoniobacterales bacterium]|nr:hypothetical protein [Chthoniobacterales bacterium]
MSEPADIAARRQRFNDAARAFTPPSPSRHAKLMPVKDGIVELRLKGASLRLIRELLATVDVAVGTDTIARFLAEVTGESTAEQAPRRSGRRRAAAQNMNYRRPAAEPAIIGPSAVAPAPAPSPHSEPPHERPRTRGPRIADPRNL